MPPVPKVRKFWTWKKLGLTALLIGVAVAIGRAGRLENFLVSEDEMDGGDDKS